MCAIYISLWYSLRSYLAFKNTDWSEIKGQIFKLWKATAATPPAWLTVMTAFYWSNWRGPFSCIICAWCVWIIYLFLLNQSFTIRLHLLLCYAVSSFNLLLCNPQGEIHGACLVWLWCRESGKFMWVVFWIVSSRTGICSTLQPVMACMLLALRWKSPSWTLMTTAPSATRSGIQRGRNEIKTC